MTNQHAQILAFASRAALPAVAGGAAQVRRLGHRRMNSQVFLVEFRDDRIRVVVKACFHPETHELDGAAARTQFDALVGASLTLAAAPHLAAPKPLAVDEQLGLVAMQYVEGHTLTHVLRKGAPDFARSEELMRCAGEWLRCYHDARLDELGVLDAASRIERLDETAEARSWRKRAPQYLQLAIADAAAKVSNYHVPLGWVHGDFKADNLLVGDALYGIDMQVRKRSLILFDLASFLNHLEMTCLYPGGWRMIGHVDALEHAFLKGYAVDTYLDIALPLSYLRFEMVLERWVELPMTTRGVRALLRPLYRMVLTRMLRSASKRIGATLARS